MYDAKDILRARLSIARKTNMAEFAISLHEELNGAGAEVPKDLADTKARVEEEWQQHVAACGPLADLVGIHEPTPQLTELVETRTFTLEHLQEAFGVTDKHVEALYAFAKFRFDCGEYDVAADYLEYYRELLPESAKSLPALWGKFAAEILNERWENADQDLALLRGAIAKAGFSPVQALQQRAWLLHWSLFVFANQPKGRDSLVEFFMLDNNLSTIVLCCPWLLRYVVAVVLTHRKKHYHMKMLLKAVAGDTTAAADPVSVPNGLQHTARVQQAHQCSLSFPRDVQMLDFLQKLLVDFDFDGAQSKLLQCAEIVDADFFLAGLITRDEFVAAARTLLFETYCRVHQSIDLKLLAGQLHMTVDEAERWVVDLIRSAQLDARVDSRTGIVQMMQQAVSM